MPSDAVIAELVPSPGGETVSTVRSGNGQTADDRLSGEEPGDDGDALVPVVGCRWRLRRGHGPGPRDPEKP